MSRLPSLAGLLLLLTPSAGIASSAPADDRRDALDRPPFAERAGELGLTFVHFNGATGELYLPEIMGAGVALLDYDGDGDLDAYLAQGSMLEPDRPLREALFPPPPGMLPLGGRLYRNDLVPRPGGGFEPRFVDVTAGSGLASGGYGMGVAVGDVDNDGDPDLYDARFGPNRLYRNRGDGSFEDVTSEAGADDPRWSVSATFFDYDRDGWLDLYVANYVGFTVATHVECVGPTSAPDYCGPQAYAPQGDRLLHNRGDGTFEDVTLRAGLEGAVGSGLGVAAADFDGDGWPDLYVANDQMPNQLWLNRRDGTFVESALLAGCALNEQGRAEASMGVTVGDPDGDGDPDLFLTHLAQETNTLFANDGRGLFQDVTLESGLGAGSFPYTAFGTGWIDYDHDGRLDLLAVNGEVKTIVSLAGRGDPFPFHQPNQLFRQQEDGRFVEVSAAAGEAFTRSEVSRGAAFGDLEGDGDTDVLISNNSGPARLLINQVGQEAGWVGVGLRGRPGSGALGTTAALVTSAARAQRRWVRTDGSYASASDPRLLFGLGDGTGPYRLRLDWPGGEKREIRGVPPGRYLVASEREHGATHGAGTASAAR